MTDRLEAMAQLQEPPERGCSRHRDHVQGCRACADSFVNDVAWYLAHPDRISKPKRELPVLDPTPCGVCGSVIGEGLMTLHMGVCPGRPKVVSDDHE